MAIVKEIDDNFFGVVVDTGANNHVDFKSDRVVSITMAALDTSAQSDEYVQVVIKKSESSKFVMCTLSKQHAILQQPVQLMLSPGENVTFEVKASKGTVNLTGYYINEDSMCGDEDGHDHAAHHHRNDLFLDEDAEEDDDDDEDEDDDEEDDDDEDDDDDDDEDDEDDEDEEEDDEEEEEESNGKRKQNGASNEANKKKKPNEDKVPQLVEAKKSSEEGVEKKIQGGVVIRDLREGKGPEAKKGKFIHVYYSGKLKSNGKQFDACTSGKPFRFRLGQGEVIKGWDVGFEGMKVGGKRQIVVPPGMGYGAKRMGNDIPANSTLVFDVELKAVS